METKKRLIGVITALVLIGALSVPLLSPTPVLAAPSVEEVTETEFDSSTTAHAVQMPATVNANDLLIVLFVNTGTSSVTTPTGWTQLSSVGHPFVRFSVYYKKATGAEDGTTVNFVTSSRCRAAAQVYRISSSSWHGTTPPEISTAATGYSNSPNPSALNPTAWGAEDTLWIAAAGIGNDPGMTSYPTNYTDGKQAQGQGGHGASECQVNSARRANTTDSENPGSFDLSGSSSDFWVAFTIAIRPAAVVTHTLTVSKDGTGSGTVTSAPAGIDCGGDCTEVYDYNTGVVLTAVADAGSTCTAWSGDGTGVAPSTRSVTMDADKAVTATFTLDTHTLTVSKDGTGTGTVTSAPAGINCGVDCTEVYDYNTGVVLTAVADAGSTCTAWSGDGTGVAPSTRSVTMDADKAVTATFTLDVQPCSITIVKETDPDTDTTTQFDFTGELGSFNLTGNGDSKKFSNLAPGTYNVTESVPACWNLTDISCDGDADVQIGHDACFDNDFDEGDDTVRITLSAGAAQSANCTFTDTKLAPVMTIDKDVVTDPPEVEPGGEVTYQIAVVNTDNADATGVFMWDGLPTGFTYASTDFISRTGGASRSSDEDDFSNLSEPHWGKFTIPSGGSVTITFTADVGTDVGPGTYDNWAYADGDCFDEIDDDPYVAHDADTPEDDPEPDEDVTIRGGPPPVGGEAYPVNKLAILMPWIALAALLAGGMGWFALRRRRRTQG